MKHKNLIANSFNENEKKTIQESIKISKKEKYFYQIVPQTKPDIRSVTREAAKQRQNV